VYNLLLLPAALLLFIWSTAANEFELYLRDTAKCQPTQNTFKHKLRIHSITLCDITIQIVTHLVDSCPQMTWSWHVFWTTVDLQSIDGYLLKPRLPRLCKSLAGRFSGQILKMQWYVRCWYSRCRIRSCKKSEVFGWSPIPNNTRSRIFCPTPTQMSSYIIFYITLLSWEFLLKWYNFLRNFCWNRFLAVYHNLRWLLIATKLLRAKKHSLYV